VSSNTPNPRGEKRRHDILTAALSLFNEHGTAEVSTNHIAAKLGISVGNLYWHFADKQAIIRALFERLRTEFDEGWALPETTDAALAAAAVALRRSFTSAWEYRFLYREIVPLTRADPEFRRLYAANRSRRRQEIGAFLRALVGLGVLRIPDDETLARLEELGWMISSFWVPHVDVRDGTLTKRAVLAGTSALFSIYLPYAAPDAVPALSRVFIDPEDES
jgi:AcrR family transcriptional regulator